MLELKINNRILFTEIVSMSILEIYVARETVHVEIRLTVRAKSQYSFVSVSAKVYFLRFLSEKG